MSDEIVMIPKTMEKFFGKKGKMVKPSSKTVAKLIKKIPKGKVATIESLLDKIAKINKVNITCPASIMKVIKMAYQDDPSLSIWRIVKQDLSLIGQFPGGIRKHSKELKNAGFKTSKNKKVPTVMATESEIYKF